ncbi:L-rhamnose-binding lectin CSL3-like [Saccostrea cucullata]|uniref:L-rhamnose-binding lectin CSL3-like n=1 Tax=Saccostrea cuccullata TaxID=36930 RepID=UPI002ED18FE5
MIIWCLHLFYHVNKLLQRYFTVHLFYIQLPVFLMQVWKYKLMEILRISSNHNKYRKKRKKMINKALGLVFLFGYTKVTAINEIACEGQTLSLSCPRGQSINITYANYGRTNPYVCFAGNSQNLPCLSNTAYREVRRTCQGQNQCFISASDSIFGDPCPDTYKYLDVDYECEIPQTGGERFYVCEDGTLNLFCTRGAVLTVFSANYGRQHPRICPGPGLNDFICLSSSTVDIVRRLCDNRESCQLEATNNLFVDNCSGRAKYLEVNVGCIYIGI